MKNKSVIVVGPESSGSMLAARVCAHVLGVAEYGTWDAVGWKESPTHKVCHRSMPYGLPPNVRWPNVQEWLQDDYDHYVIVTTRDITLSELSRIGRFRKPLEVVRQESERAKADILDVLNSDTKTFIWSYETLMYLGGAYLQEVYRFLGVESDFCPQLKDANRKRIVSKHDVSVRDAMSLLKASLFGA